MSVDSGDAKQGVRLSGKVFTWLLSLVLLACLGTLLPIVLRFQSCQDHLDFTRQAWPKAAEQLGMRFDLADALRSEGRLLLPSGWESELSRFRSSALYDEQRPPSRILDAWLSDATATSSQLDDRALQRLLSLKNSPEMTLFDQAEGQLRAVHSDFLGRLTSTIFRLKLP